MFSSTFSLIGLSDGLHAPAFFAEDVLANREAEQALQVGVDNTPPSTALSLSTPSVESYISSSTVLSLSAQDPVVNGLAAGLADTRYRINGGTLATSSLSFDLEGADGSYLLEFQSRDRLGNEELLQGRTLLFDKTAPNTSLSIQQGRQAAGAQAGSFYASSDTRLSLAAADPSVGGVASGVDLTLLKDNGGLVQPATASFSLTEGSHLLEYQSRDWVQNEEILLSTTVLVDASAPQSDLAVGAPQAVISLGLGTGPEGLVVVSSVTKLLAHSTDTISHEVASGVDSIQVRQDSATFTAQTTPFGLLGSDEVKTVFFYAKDRVGNTELEQTRQLGLDSTAPRTELSSLGGRQYQDGTSLYASSSTACRLNAEDLAVNGVASGVEFSEYALDSGAFTRFTGDVFLVEGRRRLDYRSQDRVQNLEVALSTTVFVDATPPVSAATVGEPLFVSEGKKYISAATPVTLAADDRPSNGVASGMDRIEADSDGLGFAAYGSTLIFSEGRHILAWRGVDRVGNEEAAHSLELFSDATPPITRLVPSGNFYSANSRDYAPASFTYGFAAEDPVSSGTASGLKSTSYRLDEGAFEVFGASFGLAEGKRAVEFRSRDNVLNEEVSKGATVYVDAASPVTELSIGAPSASGPLGMTFVSTHTLLSLSAIDPESGGVASGLREIGYALDGGGFSAYASPFTAGAQGERQVAYRSRDNVGNEELARSRTVTVDADAPSITALTPAGGETFIARRGNLRVSFSVADNYDAAPSSAAYLVSGRQGVPRNQRTPGSWRLLSSARGFRKRVRTSGPRRRGLGVCFGHRFRAQRGVRGLRSF